MDMQQLSGCEEITYNKYSSLLRLILPNNIVLPEYLLQACIMTSSRNSSLATGTPVCINKVAAVTASAIDGKEHTALDTDSGIP